MTQHIKTNGYGRLFVLFIGINHDKQAVIFYAALLYDKIIYVFVWFFEAFCEAISGRKKKGHELF